MLINFTNHPSDKWSLEQRNGAKVYGEIIDMPFPVVDPRASRTEIAGLAIEYAERITAISPSAVLCQGEFTLAFAVITILKSCGIKALAACSERVVREVSQNGATRKTAEFVFVAFREY